MLTCHEMRKAKMTSEATDPSSSHSMSEASLLREGSACDNEDSRE